MNNLSDLLNRIEKRILTKLKENRECITPELPRSETDITPEDIFILCDLIIRKEFETVSQILSQSSVGFNDSEEKVIRYIQGDAVADALKFNEKRADEVIDKVFKEEQEGENV